MPERALERKTRRHSTTLREPKATSLRTENEHSISDRDFFEISEKVLKGLSAEGSKRPKLTEGKS